MSDFSTRPSIRLLRKGLGVLHGTGGRDVDIRTESRLRTLEASARESPRGSTLVELLISLSILGIGVIGIAAGSRAARLQAELASSRAAEALAAQQVLERQAIWGSGDSPAFDTVRIGVHAVEVRTGVRDSMPGLVWLTVRAGTGAERVPLRLESARRIP